MKNLLLNPRSTFPETSYFIIRFFTGILMCYYHGWKKLFAGGELWSKVGSTVSDWIGIESLSYPLGFMAAFSESVAALFLAVGLITRPSALLLSFTMLVATIKKSSESGIDSSELSLLFLLIGIVILMRGPGKYSLDRMLFKK
jgi:putative oxidoreductase